MSSEDVIELGSSDDDTEPAPKKAKPMLNAMVHIPNQIADVTIQPVKKNISNLNKNLKGKSVTIKRISKPAVNPCALEAKTNRKTQHRPVGKVVKPPHHCQPALKPIPINKQPLNPVSVKKSNTEMAINKGPLKIFNEPVKLPTLPGLHLGSLPSSLTIKKNSPTQKYVAQNVGNKYNNNIKVFKTLTLLPKVNLPPKLAIVVKKSPPKQSAGNDVLTVELDDDDTNSGTNKGPQWYLRPEEQELREKIEEKNNTEPNVSNLIEITIEDSPAKSSGKHNEIGTEYPITIDESPIKFVAGGNKFLNSGDEEKKTVHRQPKTKKKLVYPNNDAAKTVEIELEPIEVYESSQEVNKSVEESVENMETEENQKSAQVEEKAVAETPPCINTTEESQPQSNSLDKQKKEDNEFHPVYQSFIDLCFELENSDDMQKIVEKKIKGYYKQVPKEYTESEEFIDMVAGKISSMKAGPERMYLYIKDVVDELNFKRKSLKTEASTKPETKDTEADKFLYGEESEFDSKRQRQIRRLEKTLKKLHRAIQKLEEQEVDFDDEEDSVYLLTERYKARMIRVHAKFCQLTNTKMPSEPRIHIEARPGQPTGPAKRVEKWINKKVPIGTPLPFPDFHDVLQCVREANKEDKLSWNEAEIMDEARDLFVRCGKKLQRRRQENEWRLAASRITVDTDPAADSAELKKKLEQNQLLAVKTETELLNKYADKQKQMKLEAVEIGDKEAEESPVESEDDYSDEEDASLRNTEKRKQRLKRLLQQKYAKDSKKKDNQDINNPKDLKEEDASDKKITDTETENKTTNTESSRKPRKPDSVNDDVNDVQSLSDDSSNINTDVDELHLLQKLHSEPEACTSTMESSDSGSPIAISDSLDSGSDDSTKEGSDDVISIENSSYSETEAYGTESVPVKTSAECSTKKIVQKQNHTNLEIDCSNVFNNVMDTDVENKLNQSNNDEVGEAVEDILLASTDEDTTDKVVSVYNEHAYVNLNDDTISIEETVIGGSDNHNSNDISNTQNDTEALVESNQAEDTQTNDDANENSQIVDKNNDKITSKKPIVKNLTNSVTSALDGNLASADTTSSSVNASLSNECRDKRDNDCDTVDNTVVSSTETMETVSTTSLCDSVNI